MFYRLIRLRLMSVSHSLQRASCKAGEVLSHAIVITANLWALEYKNTDYLRIVASLSVGCSIPPASQSKQINQNIQRTTHPKRFGSPSTAPVVIKPRTLL